MWVWRLLASRLFQSWRLVNSTPSRPQPLMRSASSKQAGRSRAGGTTLGDEHGDAAGGEVGDVGGRRLRFR